jgi:hypothetical protein
MRRAASHGIPLVADFKYQSSNQGGRGKCPAYSRDEALIPRAGLGWRPPMRPTCVVCSSDNVVDPVPGLPVFGPFAHLSNGHPAYSIVQAHATAPTRTVPRMCLHDNCLSGVIIYQFAADPACRWLVATVSVSLRCDLYLLLRE